MLFWTQNKTTNIQLNWMDRSSALSILSKAITLTSFVMRSFSLSNETVNEISSTTEYFGQWNRWNRWKWCNIFYLTKTKMTVLFIGQFRKGYTSTHTHEWHRTTTKRMKWAKSKQKEENKSMEKVNRKTSMASTQYDSSSNSIFRHIFDGFSFEFQK